MKIAMIGHKRIPSREGGIEVVVEELSTRMIKLGHNVTVYNRKGKNVQDKNASDENQKLKEYKGVKIDNAKHLTECLLTEGLVNVEVDRRKISNKILTPYRDNNGKFASVKGSCRKVYSEEFVIFARKCN